MRLNEYSFVDELKNFWAASLGSQIDALDRLEPIDAERLFYIFCEKAEVKLNRSEKDMRNEHSHLEDVVFKLSGGGILMVRVNSEYKENNEHKHCSLAEPKDYSDQFVAVFDSYSWENHDDFQRMVLDKIFE